MNAQTKREVRLVDWMVVIAVAGILASIAVPHYLGMQRGAGIESMVSTGRSSSQELLHWIDASLGDERRVVDTDGDNGLRDETLPIENARVLEAFARLHNERLLRLSPLTGEPLFVVERKELRAERCARDGRIHLIPVTAPDGRLLGAHVVVMNTMREGGPHGDGILASFRVRSGGEGQR